MQADPTAVLDGSSIELHGFGTSAGGAFNGYRADANCTMLTALTTNSVTPISATMSAIDFFFVCG